MSYRGSFTMRNTGWWVPCEQGLCLLHVHSNLHASGTGDTEPTLLELNREFLDFIEHYSYRIGISSSEKGRMNEWTSSQALTLKLYLVGSLVPPAMKQWESSETLEKPGSVQSKQGPNTWGLCLFQSSALECHIELAVSKHPLKGDNAK